jgi:hypothetical protein
LIDNNERSPKLHRKAIVPAKHLFVKKYQTQTWQLRKNVFSERLKTYPEQGDPWGVCFLISEFCFQTNASLGHYFFIRTMTNYHG